MSEPNPTNPFQDDTYATNPFDSEDPFADPSVSAAANQATAAVVEVDTVDLSGASGAVASTLEDEVSPTAESGSTDKSAIKPNSDASTSLSELERIAHSRGDMELQLVVESLRLKEKDIAQREQEMLNRETELVEREKKGIGFRQANWPSFRPIVRQDIAGDIPEKFRTVIKLCWIGVWITFAALFFNMIGMLAYLASGGASVIGAQTSEAGNDFGVSIAWLLLGFPVAFFIYRLIYNGMRKVRAANIVLFYILFGIEIGVDVYMLVGFALSGSCGIIHTAASFSQNLAASGVLCLIPVIMFLLLIFYNSFIFRTVYQFYKNKDIWEDARKEATGALVRVAADNPSVIAAAANTAAKSSVKSGTGSGASNAV